jgi:aminoglycoside/choline kinase family phosphotransferase
MSRKEQIAEFLEKSGWAGADIKPLAGDASFRRYDRVMLEGKRAVLMDAPPEFEDTRPFVAIAEYLVGIGLSAPLIYASDFEQGFLLLEDLGDDLFKTALEKDIKREQGLYDQAVLELVKLNNIPYKKILDYSGGNYKVPTYDVQRLLSEIDLFTDWYYPALMGKRMPIDKREFFRDLWTSLLRKLGTPDECLVLRDYHAENLLELENGQIGMIDFQDAVIGHSAYDLVSLLQDARRDVDPRIEELMITKYAKALGRDEQQFREQYAILGAQRNMKIIGIFARLSLRDGKNNYIAYLPRMWGLLERCLLHPVLKDIKEWVDRELPIKRHDPLEVQGLYPDHAMILAAGLGLRMRPMTDNLPKPLIKINNKEMLAHTLDGIVAAGIKTTVINMHFCADQIMDFVKNRKDWRPEIKLSDERDNLLDSGGGIKNALPLLGNNPFYILNSDMIWTERGFPALSRLATSWDNSMDILMLLVRKDKAYGHDGPGDFHMDENGRLIFRGDDPVSDFYYSGMLIIRPECFENVDEDIFSLRKLFRKAEGDGRLFGLVHEGEWYHVGIPDAVNETERLLKGE